MRAVDGSEGHEAVHLSAETDEELLRKVRQHAVDVHPELTDEQIQAIFAQLVHDE
jgi:predicted small metal-binding protein